MFQRVIFLVISEKTGLFVTFKMGRIIMCVVL